MTFEHGPVIAPLPLRSRLPAVGTTVFTVMSALAQQHNAVNLGQGFPDFDCDPRLITAVHDAMTQGANQYPPMAGVGLLREAIAAKVARVHGRRPDPQTEITVTAGATQGILTAVLALVHAGDEVIVLDPCYDSYVPAIELAGAKAVRVALSPGTFRPDFAAIAAAITTRTRALIINTPHNPTGTVWTHAEREALAALLAPTPILLLSDEVYEHMVFDEAPHLSAWGHPDLARRSVVISSFGKTFHVTGWKVGYVLAPEPLMAEFRKVHQFNVFTVNTPMQHGLACYLGDPATYEELAGFYQRKRDLFQSGLAGSRFQLLPCEGTYFQCVDYSQISEDADDAFCQWLTRTVGVAAIPLSAFYEKPTGQRVIRFCFAKRDETLQQALDLLVRL